MKIRQGFVSNSSSASFIVEVNSKPKDLKRALYENIESFSVEGCKELLEKQLKFKKKYQTPTKECSDSDINMYNYDLDELEKKIKYLEEFEEPDRYEMRSIEDEKEREMAEWRYKRHQEKVVEDALLALRWNTCMIDDGYFSINAGGPIIYNGWENIAMHAELMEVVAFLAFMKYDFRTRIENYG